MREGDNFHTPVSSWGKANLRAIQIRIGVVEGWRKLLVGDVRGMDNRSQAIGTPRKRKAENQDSERLSKRMSFLNLGSCSRSFPVYILQLLIVLAERNGQKLYVPVEQPAINSTSASSSNPKSPAQQAQTQDDDTMQLDDTKHKVYIYDLDAELSDSESSDDGRLVFLPDIRKHLRETRIPPTILANSEGELAGMNNQLVLYNVPSSLTVPEEQDSVRKAIIETRARARAKQEQIRNEETRSAQTMVASNGTDARDWYNGITNGVSAATAPQDLVYDDPDAMDLG